MSTIQMKIEKVTPAKAATFLKGNDSNRTIRKNAVKRYARDMKAGNWLESGDPIRFNGDGTLLDGQHRLSAIIESGMPQKMIVIRGLDKKSMLAMDTGAKRTFADVLKLQGFKNTNLTAAAIRWCVLYEDPERKVCFDQATNSEMMNWLAANPQITDCVNMVGSNNNVIIKKIRTPLSAIRLYAKNKHDWDLFVAKLASGLELTEGDPIHALRRYVENISIATHKPLPIIMHACVVKAWNAYMNGQSIRLLGFKAGGSAPEEFPIIVTGH